MLGVFATLALVAAGIPGPDASNLVFIAQLSEKKILAVWKDPFVDFNDAGHGFTRFGCTGTIDRCEEVAIDLVDYFLIDAAYEVRKLTPDGRKGDVILRYVEQNFFHQDTARVTFTKAVDTGDTNPKEVCRERDEQNSRPALKLLPTNRIPKLIRKLGTPVGKSQVFAYGNILDPDSSRGFYVETSPFDQDPLQSLRVYLVHSNTSKAEQLILTRATSFGFGSEFILWARDATNHYYSLRIRRFNPEFVEIINGKETDPVPIRLEPIPSDQLERGALTRELRDRLGLTEPNIY